MDIASVANAGIFAPPDLSALTVSAPSLSLLATPGLAQSLAKWDGGMTPGSQRATGSTATTSNDEPKQLTYSFNPFDEKTWWTDATTEGTNVDASA